MSERHPNITRLDFNVVVKFGETLTMVNKIEEMPERSVVVESKLSEMTLEQSVEWCQKHGWVTRQWHGGARAWKGNEPRPVRTAGQIMARRRELERWPIEGIEVHAIDLKYDL